MSNLLEQRSLVSGTKEYGRAFEHFILQECWAYRHYSKLEFPISFWRTASGSEVDLILGDAEVAIEVKASSGVADRTKGLHLFHEENNCRKSLIISKEPRPRKISSQITVLPWQNFCEMLWAGDIL